MLHVSCLTIPVVKLPFNAIQETTAAGHRQQAPVPLFSETQAQEDGDVRASGPGVDLFISTMGRVGFPTDFLGLRKTAEFCGLSSETMKIRRGETIRTSGPCFPKTVLYSTNGALSCFLPFSNRESDECSFFVFALGSP